MQSTLRLLSLSTSPDLHESSTQTAEEISKLPGVHWNASGVRLQFACGREGCSEH